MTHTTYPSPVPAHRTADIAVHVTGFALIVAATVLLMRADFSAHGAAVVWAMVVYVVCALASNLASMTYHFSPLHDRRTLLRRIDHAAIYPSISGTFTPFFVLANTTWTMSLLVICWALTALAVWNKITNATVKSRWSTASYLGLGAIGLSALPDLEGVPLTTLWWIIAGACCYVVGTAFYARKTLPFRYSLWHLCVNFGGICMFIGIWIALFQG